MATTVNVSVNHRIGRSNAQNRIKAFLKNNENLEKLLVFYNAKIKNPVVNWIDPDTAAFSFIAVIDTAKALSKEVPISRIVPSFLIPDTEVIITGKCTVQENNVALSLMINSERIEPQHKDNIRENLRIEIEKILRY